MGRKGKEDAHQIWKQSILKTRLFWQKLDTTTLQWRHKEGARGVMPWQHSPAPTPTSHLSPKYLQPELPSSQAQRKGSPLGATAAVTRVSPLVQRARRPRSRTEELEGRDRAPGTKPRSLKARAHVNNTLFLPGSLLFFIPSSLFITKYNHFAEVELKIN